MEISHLQELFSVLSGLIVGFTLGLIGGGGSVLAIPLLLYFVGIKDVHLVIGTTALAVSINAFINFFIHLRAKNVHFKSALIFSLIGIIGVMFGSYLGKLINGKSLLIFFAILMYVIAFLMIKPKEKDKREIKSEDVNIGKREYINLIVFSFATGFASGFFGIGGGFLIAPALVAATRMSLLRAVGSSLFVVGVFGLITSISYALSGYFNLKITFLYILGGIFGGYLGYKLSHKLGKTRALNYVFAFIVMLVATYILIKNLR